MAPWQPTSATMKEPKVSVTYIGDPANEGDGPKVLESWGFKFPKGEAVEVPESLAARLAKSAHFEVAGQEKPKAEPEADAPDLDSMTVAELRELADKQGMQHEGMSKAELREALRD